MNDKDRPGFWSRLGRGITRLRVILSNLLFFALLLLVVLVVFSGTPLPEVPDRGALVLNPGGAIVERRSPIDPIQRWLTPQAVVQETELSELLDALRHVREDDRVPLVVLDLDDLQFIAPAHADRIGEALAALREAGKDVIAYGSGYDQHHYLVASYADAIYMHPLGQVMLPGYAVNQLYIKNLLDRLNINVHVFRAGVYKEFVEPFTRNDMSAEAREANTELVTELWERYGNRIMGNRRIEPARFQRYTQSYPEALQETEGDLARLAVEYHLVDELLTPDQARARIADVVGYDAQGRFSGIGFRDYLEAVNGVPQGSENGPEVAVITAQGPVVTGEGVRGVIAAEEVISLIRQVREDRNLAALVLRIDTPGGSSFASELIRQELELTQLAGKPVVVSMGAVAASGGYWIAATADAIYAEPTTLTGSIGVFGIVPTFERSLEGIGVNTDGVATSSLAQVNPLTGLSDSTKRVLQMATEDVYQRFVNLVARGRDMPAERVDDIAQGRVWLGTRAQELGLVDELGSLDEAVAHAAELADLETYTMRRVEMPLSPRERLLQQLTGGLAGSLSVLGVESVLGASPAAAGNGLSPLLEHAGRTWRLARSLDDPRDSYAMCMTCWAPL